jgi:hypothetical protein
VIRSYPNKILGYAPQIASKARLLLDFLPSFRIGKGVFVESARATYVARQGGPFAETCFF